MTNFQPISKKSSFLKRENIIIGFPILLSIFISILFSIFGIIPKFKQTISTSEEIKTMKIKKSELPIKKQLLKKSNLELDAFKIQQEKLLNLIAGTKELYTYISRLNELAIVNKILITGIKPESIEKYNPNQTLPNSSQNIPNQNQNSSQVNRPDPLLVEGLEKRTIKLSVEGYFPDIINFLRLIERLPMVVITSDFKVDKFINKESSKLDSYKNYFKNKFDFTLVIYGRDL